LCHLQVIRFTDVSQSDRQLSWLMAGTGSNKTGRAGSVGS
jgi:hypothetical protein